MQVRLANKLAITDYDASWAKIADVLRTIRYRGMACEGERQRLRARPSVQDLAHHAWEQASMTTGALEVSDLFSSLNAYMIETSNASPIHGRKLGQ
jgi:hypothetical protein